MSPHDQDPVLPLPESIEVFTAEGNMLLMKELVAQGIECKRIIEKETPEVEKWTKRVQVAASQPDPSLREAAEEQLQTHKRALLRAQMDLAALEDRKTELRFQHKAPSAEQRFRTAQAQHLLAQFREQGINPDDTRIDQSMKQLSAADALQELKARAGLTQDPDPLRVAAGPVAAASAAAAPGAPAGELTPGDLRRGAQLTPEIVLKGRTWKRMDALNFGDAKAEEERGVFSEEEPQRAKTEGTFPSGRKLADEGLIFGKKLSFRLKNLAPGKDALLLLRLDVSQKHEAETLVDDAPVAAGRAPELDAQHCWRHETVLIPGTQILLEDIEVARVPKEGTKTNLFAAWLYQALS